MSDADKKAWINKLIGAGIVFAVYKFAPNQAIKAAALGVAGVMAAAYVPYVNGKALGGV